VLFNAYPHQTIYTASFVNATPVNENLLARENFFSIYGFLDGRIELQNGEFKDGLDSEYRARFRIQETR
jgi:hypothetical protein